MAKKVDWNNAPVDCWRLAMSGHGMPVGLEFYNKTIEKYPEYFPDEYRRKKIWESIPEHIHLAHRVAWDIKFREIMSSVWDSPEPGGLMDRINNPEKYLEHDKKWEVAYKKFELEEKKLHKEYYEKYGV